MERLRLLLDYCWFFEYCSQATFQLDTHEAVVERAHALLSDGTAQHVLAERLGAGRVVRGGGGGGVQREAGLGDGQRR